ncbi:MAG: hypothetical protein RLZZ214_4020 [Verrucomicrobiota bacterium]|jgi:hypothetical protein
MPLKRDIGYNDIRYNGIAYPSAQPRQVIQSKFIQCIEREGNRFLTVFHGVAWREVSCFFKRASLAMRSSLSGR